MGCSFMLYKHLGCDLRPSSFFPILHHQTSRFARKTKVKRARLWKVSGGNPIGVSVTTFLREHSVFLNLNEEAYAVECFDALMTSEILYMIVHESMRKWLQAWSYCC